MHSHEHLLVIAIIIIECNLCECCWFQVKFSRDGTVGTLDVNEELEILSLTSSGQSRTVEVTAPYYVGGVPADVTSNVAHNLEVAIYAALQCYLREQERKLEQK